jgi:hypothetical protein
MNAEKVIDNPAPIVINGARRILYAITPDETPAGVRRSNWGG